VAVRITNTPARVSNRLHFNATLQHELEFTKISQFAQEMLQTYNTKCGGYFPHVFKYFFDRDVRLFKKLAYYHKANYNYRQNTAYKSGVMFISSLGEH